MANCDSPFRFWSPTGSPRKPVQYECNNTNAARIVDRVQSNSKIPFPLDRPPSYACSPNNDSTTTNSTKKQPCCQHSQSLTPALRGPAGGGFKCAAHNKHKHKVIRLKSLASNSPREGVATTKDGQTCLYCKKYKADKEKPIEKLIADTRKNANVCAECECHVNEKEEANYLKSKGHLKGEKEKQEKEKVSSAPPVDNICMEDCVGKRVYSNKASLKKNSKKKKVPTAVPLMDWPWYWSRYFPFAASRVAQRIIQDKVDAQNAKLHPQPVAEFEVCFLPPLQKSVAEKPTGKTPERSALAEIKFDVN